MTYFLAKIGFQYISKLFAVTKIPSPKTATQELRFNSTCANNNANIAINPEIPADINKPINDFIAVLCLLDTTLLTNNGMKKFTSIIIANNIGFEVSNIFLILFYYNVPRGTFLILTHP